MSPREDAIFSHTKSAHRRSRWNHAHLVLSGVWACFLAARKHLIHNIWEHNLMNSSIRLVSEEHLKAITVQLLESVGIPNDHAERAAYILVTADLRGTTSHGIRLLSGNIRRIIEGGINPKPNITTVASTACMSIVDGDEGLGMAVGSIAMSMAMDMASEHGIGWVMARNTNHYGASGSFVMMPIEAGMVGMSISNCAPMMTIEGTLSRVMGNNPIAIGAPAREFPIVLDMATSVASIGKIGMTRRAGKPIPDEWLVTDKDESGHQVLRHFGGAKGSGLAIILEVLTGVLAGGKILSDINFTNPLKESNDVTATQVAINPALLLSEEHYHDAMSHIVAELKSAPPVDGLDEVLLPGERAWRATEKHRMEGIPVDEDAVEDFESIAKEAGTTISWE
jgi:LDH2 family malate/lactate/ureidoglycolate dehydrogenase